MKNCRILFLALLSIGFTDILLAQEKPDTTHIPLIIKPPDMGTRQASEQFEFRKMLPDSDLPKDTNPIHKRIEDSAYRSATLYMAMHEKEYKESTSKNNPPKMPVTVKYNLDPPKKSVVGKVLGYLTPLGLLALIFGEQILKDPHQMPAEERYQFEVEWKQQQRAYREKQEKEQQKIEPDSTFTLPLQKTLH